MVVVLKYGTLNPGIRFAKANAENGDYDGGQLAFDVRKHGAFTASITRNSSETDILRIKENSP